MPARWERELRRLRDAPAPLEGMRQRSEQPPRQLMSPRAPGDRWLAGIVAVVVFAAVVAFVWNAFLRSGTSAPAGGAPPPVSGPVTLWLSADRVPPGAFDVVAVLLAHEEVEATFGVHAIVDRWDGSEWARYGDVVMCMDHWHCTARIQPPGEIDAVPDIGLGARPGAPGPTERFTTDGLEVGWYRVSQTAYEGVVASGIFEVASGAPPPTPLVRDDEPAISIAPAVLSPEGGEVFLYPLVPGESDGGLSREDIQRAVEELSETARIDRWDGHAWEAVATVDLVRVPDDDLPRTAVLPSLDEGAYRLVREGPDKTLVGQLWVDASVSASRSSG
jgi:hypothetical protein